MAVTAGLLCTVLAWYGGNWTGSWVKFSLVLAAVIVLLYIPQMALPKRLAQLVLPIAAASYHIYLYHRIVPELLLPRPDLSISQPAITALAVLTGLLSGLAAFLVQKQLKAWLAERQQYATAPAFTGQH